MTRFANFISVILHPIFMMLYGMALVLYQPDSYVYYTINSQGRIFVLSLAVVVTIIAPVLILWYLLYTRKLTNIQLTDRTERLVPFIIYGGFLYMFFHFLQQLNMPVQLTSVAMVGFILVSISVVVTVFWKISMHTLALGGITGIVYWLVSSGGNFTGIFLVLLFLTGLSGYSRLVLKAHTLPQVMTGMIVGFAVALAAMQYTTQI